MRNNYRTGFHSIVLPGERDDESAAISKKFSCLKKAEFTKYFSNETIKKLPESNVP